MIIDNFSPVSPFSLQLGHGDFSAANTKVLRMVNTLAVDSEAKQSIEALQTELQKAKEKLEAIEELKTQSGNKLIISYRALCYLVACHLSHMFPGL